MNNLNSQSGCVIFAKWNGSNGCNEYIKNKTGCKPYSGAGINYRSHNKTTILKSVDDTYYYQDDMRDINHPKYTLFGHNGDQDESEKKFNEPLLNTNKTENIYLYRLVTHPVKCYIWYGNIIGLEKTVLCGYYCPIFRENYLNP